jgi:NADH dehydrogenase [ubiquinone] 1 alpha subcomplex assembly factor 5
VLGLEKHDFLFKETSERLCDRLDDITRSFPVALDLGCRTGQIARTLAGRGNIKTLIQCDLAPEMVSRAETKGSQRLAADEEALPFINRAFDLIISNLTLHWVNDLPGTLLQARRALKPDGLFLASMLGGETLKELRAALTEAEISEDGGLSPRISPMATIQDLAQLLQRAGFALPVVDTETITVMYADIMTLMTDLRSMGESNAVIENRKGLMKKSTMAAAVLNYSKNFTDNNGKMPATFQILTMTGWAPDASQQTPLKPGSASYSLIDALTIKADGD